MIVSGIMVGDPIRFIAAWLLFCFASGSIAKSRNRNVLLWILLGLLFGPFASLAVGLMPSPDSDARGGQPP